MEFEEFIIVSFAVALAVVLRWIIFRGPKWGTSLLKLLSIAAVPTLYKLLHGNFMQETLAIVGIFSAAAISIWLAKWPTDWLLYIFKVMRGVTKTVEKKADAYAALDSNGELTVHSPATSTTTNDFYALIASELDNNELDKGLWTRLYAECEGDETKTKVRYIKERLVALSAHQQAQPT